MERDDIIRMLHDDGYADAVQYIRSFENGEREFDCMKTFIRATVEIEAFGNETLMNQLRSLWTAYCLHQDLQPDTRRYDNELLELYQLVEKAKERPLSCLWDFDAFDNFMCEYLV